MQKRKEKVWSRVISAELYLISRCFIFILLLLQISLTDQYWTSTWKLHETPYCEIGLVCLSFSHPSSVLGSNRARRHASVSNAAAGDIFDRYALLSPSVLLEITNCIARIMDISPYSIPDDYDPTPVRENDAAMVTCLPTGTSGSTKRRPTMSPSSHTTQPHCWRGVCQHARTNTLAAERSLRVEFREYAMYSSPSVTC